jgi:serine/threonine protein kinase
MGVTSKGGSVDPRPGLERIALEKGWATPHQIKAAIRFQRENIARGKAITLAQALVALGILTEVQIQTAREERKPVSPPPPKVNPAPPPLIKGYRIQRRIGSGGMGEVYLAQQISLDRPVALKILPPALARNQEFVERFMSEARAAGKVAHENIVAAVDVGESNGRYYFIMELVEGPTLQELIQREGSIPEARALEIAQQVARGLRHAHQQGLIHRDIKPANIMFSSENVAKICDFGLAREIDADVTLTMPGLVQSSPAYASPEQCRARRDLDHRTDMYSLGVTLFEMLTGRRPFVADSSGALFIKHATEAPPAPQKLNPVISAGANQLVLRLLRKEPQQRFDSYDQLIDAIDTVRTAKPLSRPRGAAPAARSPASGSRFPWVAAVVGILILGTAGGLFVLLRTPAAMPRSESEAKVSPPQTELERLEKSLLTLEERAWDNPAEIPPLRARWKQILEQFRGTPQLSKLAREELEFESRLADRANQEGARILALAEREWNANHPGEALKVLRGFPEGYQGTGAAGSLAGRAGDWEMTLQERYRVDRERASALLSSAKFDDARSTLASMNSLGSFRPEWRDEIEKMKGRVEQAALAATQKASSAGLSPDSPPSVAPKTQRPSSLVQDPSRILKSALLRADPSERSKAAAAFRGLATRSALCQAAEVYLSHDDRFWKLGADRLKLKTDQVELDLEGQAATEEGKNTVFQATSGQRVVIQKDGRISLGGGGWVTPQKMELTRNLPTPLARVLADYLSALPMERVDTLSTAEQQGLFVGLAKKIWDLGEAPKEVLYLFALGHAEELLRQDTRPDAEGFRLCKLQGAKTADFWGPPASVNRLALARTLGSASPADVHRAAEVVATSVDFPSRLLSALAIFREKDFDPVGASAAWKKLSGMAPESAAGKFAEEVAERIKKAAICEGCSGQGKYPCKKCAASGIADCDKCKGTGRIKEGDSGGLGSYFGGMVPCPACKQKGKLTCPVCLGGRLAKCDKCEGKKIRRTIPGAEFVELVGSHLCPACSGTGGVYSKIGYPCPDCGGMGRFPSK